MSREQSGQSNACVLPVKISEGGCEGGEEEIICWNFGFKTSHTNFSEQGKSKSLMRPKSSPVTRLRPTWETQAQLTSAFSALRGQTPITSSPRMLGKQRTFLKLYEVEVPYTS